MPLSLLRVNGLSSPTLSSLTLPPSLLSYLPTSLPPYLPTSLPNSMGKCRESDIMGLFLSLRSRSGLACAHGSMRAASASSSAPRPVDGLMADG